MIVTSSAAAGVYLERNIANLRLGMTLELFTACGALAGGSVASVDERLLTFLFSGLLVYVAITMLQAQPAPPDDGRGFAAGPRRRRRPPRRAADGR